MRSKKKKKKFTWSDETVGIYPQGVTQESDISNIILDYAAPLLEECDTKKDIKKTLKFAIVVWNASVAHKDQWKEFVADFSRTFVTPEGIKQARHFIRLLHNRKKRYYPDVNLVIRDYALRGRNVMRFKVKYSEFQANGVGLILTKKA